MKPNQATECAVSSTNNPSGEDAGRSVRETPLLEVKGLRKHYPIRRGFLSRTRGFVKAVDGVDFTIQRGETLGLVGESGCGKSTTGRCLLRAVDATEGQVRYWMSDESGWTDIYALEGEDLRRFRRFAQMIFQDPFSSLNPRMTLLQIVGEPLTVNRLASGEELEHRVADLLRRVGLRPEYMKRYPHAFSGGQRQRIGIARSLALEPNFIVCDEPVSALDVSIQAQTLNLLQDLQEEFHLTYLFVAHDLNVVAHIADRVAVMYVGKMVELAESDDLFARPLHPYTEVLMSSVLPPDPRIKTRQIEMTGEVANPADPPSGCYFHPRCQYAEDRCRHETPELREIRPNHFVSCHRAEEITLQGVL